MIVFLHVSQKLYLLLQFLYLALHDQCLQVVLILRIRRRYILALAESVQTALLHLAIPIALLR